jgi:non-ribosomal peptide synthetase-like protein
MPGADVGVGAEIEPGTVVTGYVPEGERWTGAPAAPVGMAGESWPGTPPDPSPRRRLWKAMYGAGLAVLSLVPLIAALPGLAIMSMLDPGLLRLQVSVATLLVAVPLAAASYILAYALIVALLVRAVGPILRPGWHGDDGGVAWALWFSEAAMSGSRTVLFPLYASLYVKPWLRLVGVRVGARTEVSTAVGLNRLATIGETSFLADDVVFAMGRGRGGWLHLTAIDVGSRTFLGNSALLGSGTVVGDDSLVGALSSPPARSDHGTSWMGLPAIELPRVPDPVDPARTTHPPARLLVTRAVLEMVRILLPTTISAMLGVGVLTSLAAIGGATGSVAAVIVAAPLVVAIASVAAAAITVAIKWVLIGRYRPGDHPLWSTFVWRDEIVNTCHEQLAGEWLLGLILGTAFMPIYLRAMGARIGTDVWFETTSISEFDLVDISDGATINRGAVIETHLFHDRLMRLGPSVIGRGATLGPHSAVFPDTALGDGCSVGARSFVMRGERLPAHTRWHGAPVVAVG